MRIFATKEIECGGQMRLFKVNLFATARFCEHKGTKLSQLEQQLVDPSLLDIMLLAYFSLVQVDKPVEIDEFMAWFDDSDLFEEFPLLMNEAFSQDAKPGKQRGKPTKAR
jgi:hypothetical protein